MTHVSFLGAPALDGSEVGRPRSPEGWKPICLLAYLCMDRPVGYRTDTELARMLWPDLPAPRAGAALDRAVEVLNAGRPTPLVDRTRFGEYAVNLDAVRLDVWVFRGGIRMGRYEDAVQHYGGRVLEGIDLPRAPLFMEWLHRQRVKYARLASACNWRIHEKAGETGDDATAEDTLVAAWATSPRPEAIVARVLDGLVARGAIAKARDVAERQRARAMEREEELPDYVDRRTRTILGLPPRDEPDSRRPTRARTLVAAGLVVLTAAVAIPLGSGFGSSLEPPDAPAPLPMKGRPGSAAPGSPSARAVWLAATRGLTHGDFVGAERLFTSLLAHPRYGTGAALGSVAARTARRTPGPVGVPLLPATAGALAALAAFQGGDTARAGAIIDETAEGAPYLQAARVYRAWYAGRFAEVDDLLSGAPDTVLAPVEGPIPNAQFRGWAALAAGDTVRGREHFEEARRVVRARIATRASPWDHYGLALAELALGRRGLALAEVRQAMVLGSDDPRLAFELQEVTALIRGPRSSAGGRLVRFLLRARYPWPLTEFHLEHDPRWR